MTENYTAQLPVFDRLANLFTEMGVFVSPSEFHGLLCGQLAQGKAVTVNDWLQDVAGYLERERIDDGVVTGELARLYQLTDEQLRGTGFGLELVIPDEEAELAQRVASIGLWCQGFLTGFRNGPTRRLSSEAQETLEDFAEIARIEEASLDESEENEQDLMQVMEYVRMAAILIYSEARGGPATKQPGVPPLLH